MGQRRQHSKLRSATQFPHRARSKDATRGSWPYYSHNLRSLSTRFPRPYTGGGCPGVRSISSCRIMTVQKERLSCETTNYVKPNIRAARRSLGDKFLIRCWKHNGVKISIFIPYFSKIASIFELLFECERLCWNSGKICFRVTHGHQTVWMVRRLTM